MRTTPLHVLLAAFAAAAAACGSVTTGGTSKPNLPTVTGVMPDHGPAPGGATITLTGSHFSGGDPTVVVGGHTATGVMVTGDTMLTFTLPAGVQGSIVDVTVATDVGAGTKSQAFTYNAAPIALSVAPAHGKIVGGTAITITGSGFQAMDAGSAAVEIAGGMATNVTVVDDHTITAVTGAAAAGTQPFAPVDVVVSNANGSSTLSNQFELTAHGLLVVDRCCTSTVYFVDPATAAVTPIGTAPQSLHACAPDPSSGKLYAIARLDRRTDDKALVTWDPVAGSISYIGTLRDAANTPRGMASLAFDNGVLYGVSASNPNPSSLLMSVNTATGVVTPIGSTALPVGRENGVAFRDNSTVYVADQTNQTLDTISLSSGALTAGPPITGGTNALVKGLVQIGSTLYLMERNTPSVIYSINPATGSMIPLVTLPALEGAMCETPSSY